MTDLYTLLEELRAIARNGLHFSSDPYDQERYARLMDLVTRQYGDLLGAPPEALRQRFLAETGYVTPKLGADAAIFNDKGEILLMERSDGSGWCLPCGWVEPNEKPAQTAVRETREETGLDIEVEQLVGVFSRPANAQNGTHSMVAVVHLCRVIGGELRLSHEGLGLRYWPVDDVPFWHATHEHYARIAQQVWRSGMPQPAISD